MVLFYVYPLKFLFTLITTGNHIIKEGVDIRRISSVEEIRHLMVIYSAGFIAVYVSFLLMYLHAWRKKEELRLHEVERFHLKTAIYKSILLIMIGALVVIVSLIISDYYASSTGMLFILISPGMTILFRLRAKKLKGLISAEELQLHYETVAKSKRGMHVSHLE